jgi:lipopolysaccharide transport system permease protein
MHKLETIHIDAKTAKTHYWKDIFRYKDLLYFLSLRDILVRYKQTVIGVAWAAIRPLLTMVIFTFVFGQVAKLPSAGVPYPLMVFSAMLPWYFFSGAFVEISNSLISNSNMISKIYFPRIIIPLSTTAVCLVDFLISLLIMAGLMVWYGFLPNMNLIFLPFFLLFAVITSFGIGLWFAALNVKYRDFRYIVPFMVQVGLYISPVGFNVSMVPEQFKLLYYLNPMVSVIDGFRWCLLGGEYTVYLPGLFMSLTLVSVLLYLGVAFFRKTENTFADII